jgi:hypothetical protein
VASDRARELQADVLLISNYELTPMTHPVREIASFQGAIVEDENYHVYVARYKGNAASDEPH